MTIDEILRDVYFWTTGILTVGQASMFIYLVKDGGRKGLSEWLRSLSKVDQSGIVFLQNLREQLPYTETSEQACQDVCASLYACVGADLQRERHDQRLGTAYLAGTVTLIASVLGVGFSIWSHGSPEDPLASTFRLHACVVAYLATAIELYAGAGLAYLYINDPPSRIERQSTAEDAHRRLATRGDERLPRAAGGRGSANRSR